MEPTTGPDEILLGLLTGTALDILDPRPSKRAEREARYNPGPSSTSRKKRTQVGARGLPRKRAERTAWQDVATRVKKHKAKKRARQAIGARGVKTNTRRPSKRTQSVAE